MSIAQVLAEGRLIRNEWSRVENGRELLCLYTAMVGDGAARPEGCPAHLCPKWLAHLLPWMDDYGSQAAWPAMVERVAELAPHFGKLRPCVEWQALAACVREAMRHMGQKDGLNVCQHAVDLCERRGRGEEVPDEEFAAARAAAEATAEAAAEAADASARADAAAWASAARAWASAASAVAANVASAAWAAEAAVRAARAAKTAAVRAARAAKAAEATAVDRLTTAILDLIEADLREQGLLSA